MKKDKLKRQVEGTFRRFGNNDLNPYELRIRILELIDQLDEPEAVETLLVPTLSEMETVEITEEQVMEWLDNNEFYCHATAETVLENAVDKGELGYYGTKYAVVEKPVIPKFVAKWIESRDYYNVYKVLQDLSVPGSPHASKDVRNWIFRNQENVENFVRAWLDGYVVEAEQKYYVSVRDEEYGGFWFLSKNNNGEISIGVGRDWSEVDWDRLKLTEQEIKDYDPRYMTFAKPVEELEE